MPSVRHFICRCGPPSPTNEERAHRHARILCRVSRHNRLIAWMEFLRHESDRGTGDTASRLAVQASHHPDAFAELDGLLRMCSCARPDAVARLNVEHPYGYCRDDAQHDQIDSLVAVTSLAPRPSKRQTAALNSWRNFGLEIHAVNTAAEIDTLRAVYPQVGHWHSQEETSVGFSKPTQLIWNIANVAKELHKSILIINADIEIIGEPTTLLDRIVDGMFLAGIRHNYSDTIMRATREPWGIDAFVITPEMAATLPRATMAIGQPMWDYWLPYHFRELGYDVDLVGEPLFFHREHKLAWTSDDWTSSAKRLAAETGIDLECTALQFRRSLPFPPPKTQWE